MFWHYLLFVVYCLLAWFNFRALRGGKYPFYFFTPLLVFGLAGAAGAVTEALIILKLI